MVRNKDLLHQIQSRNHKPKVEGNCLRLKVFYNLQDSFSTQIVRLGGLLGGDRHPVKQLAKLPVIDNPQAPVNLIHKADAIGLLRYLADQAPWQSIYNGVAPWHPTKQDFYEQAAKEMQLPLPKFTEEPGNTNKVVTDPQIESFGYTFIEPKLGLVRSSLAIRL